MRKIMLALTLAALCLGAVACSDDDPVKPQEFAVTLNVVDRDGNPVEGLRVGMVNDTPYYQDGGLQSAKASVRIQFQVPQEVGVRITIEDVEGQEIRLLVDDELMAGVHQIIWDGRDQAGVYQPSGRYTAHMVATQKGTGLWAFEDRTDMLLAMLDSSKVPTGYTDAKGRLVLKDKKLFPHLYDLPDMMATDENSELLGKLVLTPLMRISLVDENAHQSMGFKEDVVEGTVLNLLWNPHLPEPPQVVGPQPATSQLGNAIPPAEFRLYSVYPNPFN